MKIAQGIMGYRDRIAPCFPTISGPHDEGPFRLARVRAIEGDQQIAIRYLNDGIRDGSDVAGGRGTMIGALGGVLLLVSINSGLNLSNVSPFWIETIRGLVILIAMLIDAQKVRFTAPSVTVVEAEPAASAAGS